MGLAGEHAVSGRWNPTLLEREIARATWSPDPGVGDTALEHWRTGVVAAAAGRRLGRGWAKLKVVFAPVEQPAFTLWEGVHKHRPGSARSPEDRTVL